MKQLFAPLCLLLALLSCSPKQEATKISQYPATKKVDTVNTFFGTAVQDPYRWLENDTTKETADWVAAQNEVTFGYLKNIPFRDAIR
ncbi:MAG: S9 family peptidase, partial [Cyclobacteriaceae bacterium]|nr:S9 family peptidase [Cyclobacteriaceae bacterium]